MRFYPNIPSRVFRHVPLVHGKDVTRVFEGVGLVHSCTRLRHVPSWLTLSEDSGFCDPRTGSDFVDA